MENNSYVLYDNHEINYDDLFEDFKDYCNDNNIDYSKYDKDSEYFHNWVYDTLNEYWNDFISNLIHDKNNNVDCVVTGNVGTWRGNFEIVATHFDTLENAIYSCIKNCDYITIKQTENGAINVLARHHDGSHNFTIYKLNKRGYDAKCHDKDLNNVKYFDKFNFIY